MTHPDLDYYDLMPLDELQRWVDIGNPSAIHQWHTRRAVRDAFLDLAEEMDERGDVVLCAADLDFLAEANFRAGQNNMLEAGYTITDYDNG